MIPPYVLHRFRRALDRCGIGEREIPKLQGRTRHPDTVADRRRVAWLMRQPDATGDYCSYPQIASLLRAGRKHTGALKQAQSHQPTADDLETEPAWQDAVYGNVRPVRAVSEYVRRRFLAAAELVGVNPDEIALPIYRNQGLRKARRIALHMRQPDDEGRYCTYDEIGDCLKRDDTTVAYWLRDDPMPRRSCFGRPMSKSVTISDEHLKQKLRLARA